MKSFLTEREDWGTTSGAPVFGPLVWNGGIVGRSCERCQLHLFSLRSPCISVSSAFEVLFNAENAEIHGGRRGDFQGARHTVGCRHITLAEAHSSHKSDRSRINYCIP